MVMLPMGRAHAGRRQRFVLGDTDSRIIVPAQPSKSPYGPPVNVQRTSYYHSGEYRIMDVPIFEFQGDEIHYSANSLDLRHERLSRQADDHERIIRTWSI